jgi:uroporphyrinogen-III decarboxylase
VLESPPAWLPVRGWPTRSADGTRVLLYGERVLVAPPDKDPVDVVAAETSSTRDVWDRREDFDVAAMPDPPTTSEAIADGWVDHPRRFVERWGGDYLLHGQMGTPYWAVYSRLGFGGMMETMLTEPELLEQIIDNHLERLRTRLDVYAEAGVECVFIEETLSSSDLISEDNYLRFSFTSNRDLLEHARDLGLRTVYYYCGAIEDRLAHLAELPADALAFEESKKAFEIELADVREAVGPDRPLLGNIDATFVRDTDEAGIRRAVNAQFEAAGPLLATCTGSPLILDTSSGKLDLMVECTEQLG